MAGLVGPRPSAAAVRNNGNFTLTPILPKIAAWGGKERRNLPDGKLALRQPKRDDRLIGSRLRTNSSEDVAAGWLVLPEHTGLPLAHHSVPALLKLLFIQGQRETKPFERACGCGNQFLFVRTLDIDFAKPVMRDSHDKIARLMSQRPSVSTLLETKGTAPRIIKHLKTRR